MINYLTKQSRILQACPLDFATLHHGYFLRVALMQRSEIKVFDLFQITLWQASNLLDFAALHHGYLFRMA